MRQDIIAITRILFWILVILFISVALMFTNLLKTLSKIHQTKKVLIAEKRTISNLLIAITYIECFCFISSFS